MKRTTRFLAFFMAALMCFGFTVSASAAEALINSPEAVQGQLITYEVTADENGVMSVSSSIDGYGQATLTTNNLMITIPVTASGSGGMGITVKTSSSWNGYTSMFITSNMGTTYVNNYAMHSNSEVQFHNLTHYCPRTMIVGLEGIPSGKSVLVKVWIYG